jgi:hypothetical protein
MVIKNVLAEKYRETMKPNTGTWMQIGTGVSVINYRYFVLNRATEWRHTVNQ